MSDATTATDPARALLAPGDASPGSPLRYWLLVGCLGLTLGLSGCARRYVITLSNSDTLIATTKPKSDGQGWYVFKDANGQETRVKELRVIQIEAK
jgi:hypothetical protein